MVKISGVVVQNYPDGYENRLGELMQGEMNSTSMAGLKTPQYVYGRSVNEIQEFCKKFRKFDPSFDIVFIYDIEESGVREYLFTRYIEND